MTVVRWLCTDHEMTLWRIEWILIGLIVAVNALAAFVNIVALVVGAAS